MRIRLTHRIKTRRVHGIGSPLDIKLALLVHSFVTSLKTRFHQMRHKAGNVGSVFLFPSYQHIELPYLPKLKVFERKRRVGCVCRRDTTCQGYDMRPQE